MPKSLRNLRPAIALMALLALAAPAAAAPARDSGAPLAWLTDAWSAAVQWIVEEAGLGTAPNADAPAPAPAPQPQASGDGGDHGPHADPDL